jgi:hypothetical protein
MKTTFVPVDFELKQGDTISLTITVKDACGRLIAPIAGTIGRLAIAVDPAAPALLQLNSHDDTRIWFTSMLPKWKLNVNLFSDDTASLAPGLFYYEFRIDVPDGGQFTIKAGWFKLLPALISSP